MAEIDPRDAAWNEVITHSDDPTYQAIVQQAAVEIEGHVENPWDDVIYDTNTISDFVVEALTDVHGFAEKDVIDVLFTKRMLSKLLYAKEFEEQ